MSVFMQAILKGALLPEHIAQGVELFEPDDHMLVLRCKGEVIATYASTGAKIEEIRKDTDEWLLQKEIILAKERHNA